MAKLLQDIVPSDILKLGAAHKGYRHERMAYPDNERERIFYRHWKKENKRLPWINFGQGILQDLFAISGKGFFRVSGWNVIIKKRDQYIVATVIQWLGTNCGWCFLLEVLRECGYDVVKTDERRIKERKESIKRMATETNKKIGLFKEIINPSFLNKKIMKAPNITKGDWTLGEGSNFANRLPININGKRIIVIEDYRNEEIGNYSELEANAKLIAAAPDMADKLNICLHRFRLALSILNDAQIDKMEFDLLQHTLSEGKAALTKAGYTE